jgi:GT2 family glycosyltransferase
MLTVTINILLYNGNKFLDFILPSILGQDYPEKEVVVIDNASHEDPTPYIQEHYPQIRVIRNPQNLGFAAGHNVGIRASRADLVLCLNQDLILGKTYTSKLVAEFEKTPRLAAASGKLYHYDFHKMVKTRSLDTTGLEVFMTRRVIDRGQWEEDNGSYDSVRDVFGVSGAAPMYRREALEDIKVPRRGGGFEYFDEDFFMYKEDIDLAWRMRLRGWKARYVPEAVGYHGRTSGRAWPHEVIPFIQQRKKIPMWVRKLSLRNHYLMIVKNDLSILFWRHAFLIFIRELLHLLYTAFFEPTVLIAYPRFFWLFPRAWRKRRYIQARVTAKPSDIRYWFKPRGELWW